MSAPEPHPNSLTSFAQLFGQKIGGHTILEIEIPLVQRDYAQGRKTEHVGRIRENFINALGKALLPDSDAIELDFVFGDLEEKSAENQGKFLPLDGQQRLTTLFLLHCYLAWQNDVRPQDHAWSNFTYATRPGARDFCDFLVRCKPDFSVTLSAWIQDHADYLPTWKHDPTIQSMLVMLDALHAWFVAKAPDLQLAWTKLVDAENPAIRFHLLPMAANGLTDALYIKMNSRGKPLTPFENFKAHFEDVLKKVHVDLANDFANKVDTDWSNILWPYKGEDHLIDDEFMRYFRFITEVCAWKNGIVFKDSDRTEDLAERVFAVEATNAVADLTFHNRAWDVWKEREVKAEFERMLTAEPIRASTALLMFNPIKDEGVDLFHACCRHHGTRQWTLPHTLLLYGALLALMHKIPEAVFPKRLRILRNLIEASGAEIRAGERNNMPKLLVEVEQIIVQGNLTGVSTFNQVQVRNEGDKAAMLDASPTLAPILSRLEDHPLLRGGLTVFELDPAQFAHRAETFIAMFDKATFHGGTPWKLITGALLAKGDYSRQENRWTGHRSAAFGAPHQDEPWQSLFRGKKGELVHPASKPLAVLLDSVAAGSTLQEVIDAYLYSPDTPKDWRYYFVKYEAMREGASGRYTISPSGYQACMLDKERMSSHYYDPYLLATARRAMVPPQRIADPHWPKCFTSEETNARKMALKHSGIQIECVDQGWQMSQLPENVTQREAFDNVRSNLGIGTDCIYVVPQTDATDTLDRVEQGAKLLAALVGAGL